MRSKYHCPCGTQHNHGNENSRQFGGYDPETGEVINAITGRTPSQQAAMNDALEQRELANPQVLAAYKDAMAAYESWNDSENEFGFGGKDYPQQEQLDATRKAWFDIKNAPVESKPKGTKEVPQEVSQIVNKALGAKEN